MTWSIGSLFTGILGLDWPWLDQHHAWVSEVDPAASDVLAHQLPEVPNLGDVTAVDWSTVEPVDVLIGGGFPCQPFSVAGKRKGAADDRYLWSEVLRAVRDLRPRLVVLENTPTVVNRADGLPRFAGDLAAVGYDVRWTSLRAADVGAPHRRKRWLALAYASGPGIGPDPGKSPGHEDRHGQADDYQPRSPGPGRLHPTPQASDGTRGPDYARARERRTTHGSGGDDLSTTAAKLFPTPTAARGGIENLLPTPLATDANGARRLASAAAWGPNTVVGTTLGDVAYADTWGDYAPAIARWAEVMGPPPSPTKGRTLAAPFVEWLMGFPSGWVTELAPRRAALRMLGNAVVPHVAAAALDTLTEPPPA